MSDQREMICATPVMRTGPTRIGRIGSFSLPRTVAITTLAACVIGAIIGLVIAQVLSSGISAFLYGAIFGGGAGWFVVTYSPLKGESMAKWFLLKINASRRGRYIDGERVTLAVGTAVLPRPPVGKTKILRSAVHIPATQYDDRGVLLSPKNKNLPDDGTIDPLLFAALSLPGERGTSLTPVTGSTLENRRRPSMSRRVQSGGPGASTQTHDTSLGERPQRLKD